MNEVSIDIRNEPDDDPARNLNLAITVVRCPDIVVEKTAEQEVVEAGESIAFTITAANTGDGDADDVVLTDELPSGIDWSEQPGSDTLDACEISGETDSHVLTCTVEILPAGNSFSVTVTGETDEADFGTVENTATISADNEAVIDRDDNSASAEITIECPVLGEVVILKFFCPTFGEAGTIFEVTTPRALGSTLSPGGCTPGAGISFTITGDNLPEPLSVTTGPDGTVTIELEAGEYEITEDSTGAGATFTVEPDATIVVAAYNLEHVPAGSLVIRKYWCESADTKTGFYVAGPGEATAPIPDDCTPGDATFQIDDLAPFSVGVDGEAVLTVAAGQHVITETGTGTSAEFTISDGETTTIVVLNKLEPPCDPVTDTEDCPPALPNTGAGAGAMQPTGPSIAWSLLAAWSVLVVCAVAWHVRRRLDVP